MDLLVGGDYCPNYRLARPGYKFQGTIDKQIVSFFNAVDISIVNLEYVLNRNNNLGIQKQGPCLKGSAESIKYLKDIGISHVTCANNHIADYGVEGIVSTIDFLSEIGIEYVGVGNNSDEASSFKCVTKHGKTLALINCCETEFSIASMSKAGANPLNPIKQYYSIKEARIKADYVVVIVHGGIEHFQFPTLRMKEVYRFFIDAGADVVINHHQHCYSGYEIYNGKPIFYGIGNFCFDWAGKRNSIWNEGYLIKMHFDKNGVDFELYPYIQCNESANVQLMSEKQIREFNARIAEINVVIADDIKLKAQLDEYMNANSFDYELALSPYSCRYTTALFRRGMLPSFISKNRIIRFYDYLKCESHRERFIHFIEEQYKKYDI